ncbi:MAG TPA: MoxR family ATPase [Myxococcota bacterium]|nr:MoxR family ATPase [Myxococcota bacterium]
MAAEDERAGAQVEAMDPAAAADAAGRFRANVERALRGKTEVVRRAVETFVSGGHLLIEDVPGVGKTTLARALARSVEASFRRIQFTSDLLPSDVLGASVPELAAGRATGRFVFQPGPLFAQVVLADEINRASPKTQSALLEAMSEGRVTLDGRTHRLPEPFFVVATQNPAEHHGTSPLPESQLDRFRMRLRLGYPEPADEAALVRDDPALHALPELEPVLSVENVLAMRAAAERVKLADAVIAYLLAIVAETRQHDAVHLGVSPRGALSLRRAAQARALVDGRDFCIPEDVRELAVDVLAHRIVIDPRGNLQRGVEESEWLVREILEQVPVPL